MERATNTDGRPVATSRGMALPMDTKTANLHVNRPCPKQRNVYQGTYGSLQPSLRKCIFCRKNETHRRKPRFPWTLLLTKFIFYGWFLRLFCKRHRKKGRVAAGTVGSLVVSLVQQNKQKAAKRKSTVHHTFDSLVFIHLCL